MRGVGPLQSVASWIILLPAVFVLGCADHPRLSDPEGEETAQFTLGPAHEYAIPPGGEAILQDSLTQCALRFPEGGAGVVSVARISDRTGGTLRRERLRHRVRRAGASRGRRPGDGGGSPDGLRLRPRRWSLRRRHAGIGTLDRRARSRHPRSRGRVPPRDALRAAGHVGPSDRRRSRGRDRSVDGAPWFQPLLVLVDPGRQQRRDADAAYGTAGQQLRGQLSCGPRAGAPGSRSAPR